MTSQKPRQGEIYILNPDKVSLTCTDGHTYIYELGELTEVECKFTSCTIKINPSRVFRGTHPHIIWTSDQFQDDTSYIKTFNVIPLSSKETFKGLPTTYPIKLRDKNNLKENSYALVHQIYTVDANCLKNQQNQWLKCIGKIDKKDKEAIKERLKYLFNIQDNPNDEWFSQNASPELLKKIFNYLPAHLKESALNNLMDDF